ncbi:MAG: hypothetical protein ABEK42_03950 [Thiohalorhabdaceae bacterium]
MPLWLLGRAAPCLPLHPRPDPALPGAPVRAAARPHRCSAGGAGPAGGGATPRDGRGGRAVGGGPPTRGGGPGPASSGHGRPAGELSGEGVRTYCRPDDDGLAFLETASKRLGLSARAYHRILKLARTVADLAGEATIGQGHIAEAVHYRRLDSQTDGST